MPSSQPETCELLSLPSSSWRKSKSKFKAVNSQFADLQGENKQLVQKVGNGGGGREPFKQSVKKLQLSDCTEELTTRRFRRAGPEE